MPCAALSHEAIFRSSHSGGTAPKRFDSPRVAARVFAQASSRKRFPQFVSDACAAVCIDLVAHRVDPLTFTTMCTDSVARSKALHTSVLNLAEKYLYSTSVRT